MSLENVKHIVLILSGKGGVGKSSITTQLALSLSLAGHSVGILDIDLTGPSIPRLLGIESAKITQAPGGWLPVQVHPSQILPPLPSQAAAAASTTGQASTTHTVPNGSTHGASPFSTTPANNGAGEHPIGSVHCMSLGFLLKNRNDAVVWRGPKKTAMVRQFLTSVLWPSIDYLLIDTPPGTSDEHISLVETLLKSTSPNNPNQVAGAVVVTTPQAVAVSDVRKEINFCAKVGVKVLGVVENMSGYVCECCGVGVNIFGRGGGEVMSQEFGVIFLGRVPLDGQWGRLVEEGRRPSYGPVENNGVDGGMEEQREEELEVEGKDEGKEEELLVDKYRSCSLCPTFEGITKQVVDIVEARGMALGP